MYFLYPETCGVRLEDMGSLFGDSTTAMGTPASGTPAMRAEADALIRPGSPVPPLDIRNARRPFGSTGPGVGAALPGLNIDPPNEVEIDTKPKRHARFNGESSGGRGIGGWVSRMLGRGGDSSANGDGASGSNGTGSAQYAPLDQRGD